MIVDERGKPFRHPLDWGGSEHVRWAVKRALEELARPSPLLQMLELGRLRAVAEECQRWENKGTLPASGAVKFRMEGRYE